VQTTVRAKDEEKARDGGVVLFTASVVDRTYIKYLQPPAIVYNPRHHYEAFDMHQRASTWNETWGWRAGFSHFAHVQ